MRGFGIHAATPVQTLPVKATAQASSPRHGRLTKATLESPALTTLAILVGFGAVAPFIVAAILNPPPSSITNRGYPDFTASIATAPLPELPETVVRHVGIAPDGLPSGRQREGMRSAEIGRAVLGAQTHNKRRLGPALPPTATTEESADLDRLTEVFRTALEDAWPAIESQADAQPEPTELAAAEQKVPIKPVAKPSPAAREPSPSYRSARVRRDVRMRAGPRNSAAVLTVVRAGSEVEVIKCRYWCEVAFNGRRGWIYRSFVR